MRLLLGEYLNYVWKGKCIRCRKSFKFEELQPGPDGFALCEACASKAKSTFEQKMLCPNDNQQMRKPFIKHLLVAICDRCGGVWLNNYELEILNRELGGLYHNYFAVELFNTLINESNKNKDEP